MYVQKQISEGERNLLKNFHKCALMSVYLTVCVGIKLYVYTEKKK